MCVERKISLQLPCVQSKIGFYCFFQESFASIVQAIKSAGNLPAAGEDHDFYYSFSDFREFRTAQGARLLSK